MPLWAALRLSTLLGRLPSLARTAEQQNDSELSGTCCFLHDKHLRSAYNRRDKAEYAKVIAVSEGLPKRSSTSSMCGFIGIISSGSTPSSSLRAEGESLTEQKQHLGTLAR